MYQSDNLSDIDSITSDIDIDREDLKHLTKEQRTQLFGLDFDSDISDGEIEVKMANKNKTNINEFDIIKSFKITSADNTPNELSDCIITSELNGNDRTQSSFCSKQEDDREEHYLRKILVFGGGDATKAGNLHGRNENSNDNERVNHEAIAIKKPKMERTIDNKSPTQTRDRNKIEKQARGEIKSLDMAKDVHQQSKKESIKNTIKLAIYNAVMHQTQKNKTLITIENVTDTKTRIMMEKMIDEFVRNNDLCKQNKPRLWHIEKQNMMNIEFPFTRDKLSFMRDPSCKEILKNVPNYNDPEGCNFIKKPVRMIMNITPKFKTDIIENNLKRCISNILNFKETKPNSNLGNRRMIFWATDKMGFNSLNNMNWKLPYINEDTMKISYIDIKLDGKINRCNDCYSLMGKKPHNCQGKRCIRCNEFGHDKKDCEETDIKGCPNCNFSFPKHTATNNSCAAYINRVYEKLMECDIPDDFLKTDYTFDERKIMNITRIVNM